MNTKKGKSSQCALYPQPAGSEQENKKEYGCELHNGAKSRADVPKSSSELPRGVLCFLVQATPFDGHFVGGLEDVCEVLQGVANRNFVRNGLTGIDWLSQAHELTVLYSRHLSR